MSGRAWVLRALLLAVLGLTAACGDDDTVATVPRTAPGGGELTRVVRNEDNADTTITVGGKAFTEQRVLAEVYAQALEAAGYRVRRRLDIPDEQRALADLRAGRISGYPEYTGTILLSFLRTPPDRIPTDEQVAYTQAREGLARAGIEAFAPTPFTSSNEVAIRKDKAEELGVQRISDLEDRASELTLSGAPECRVRRDCLVGLREVYGLRFEEFLPTSLSRRHRVLRTGEADLSVVFTTDPQIQRSGEVLLEDDKGMFPPNNSTFLVRRETVEEAGPDLQRTIETVNVSLSNEVMQELNARVDLDGEPPSRVAGDYLQQLGLVGG